MVDFFNLRVRKVCERLNPPSYEDKIPNCSFPQCAGEDGHACVAGINIARKLNDKVDANSIKVEDVFP